MQSAPISRALRVRLEPALATPWVQEDGEGYLSLFPWVLFLLSLLQVGGGDTGARVSLSSVPLIDEQWEGSGRAMCRVEFDTGTTQVVDIKKEGTRLSFLPCFRRA